MLRHHTIQYIDHHVKSEVAITLRCQLYSIRLPTSIQIEKYLKSNSVIKAASMKNAENFPLQRGGSHH